jgi:hypothetical protein
VEGEPDERAMVVSGGRSEAGVPFRERAPGGPWAGCWPGPECCPAAFLGFSLFPFPFFLISSIFFFFVNFAKTLQIDSNQLLKFVN